MLLWAKQAQYAQMRQKSIGIELKLPTNIEGTLSQKLILSNLTFTQSQMLSLSRFLVRSVRAEKNAGQEGLGCDTDTDADVDADADTDADADADTDAVPGLESPTKISVETFFESIRNKKFSRPMLFSLKRSKEMKSVFSLA